MKTDTLTIQLALAIAEEGSISRAADKLQLAVAAASKRLTDLERQLGTPLFKRVPHGVKLTESGTKLLAHIRQIDSLIGRLGDDAHSMREGQDGRIIIGAPKAAIIEFLARDLARVQRRYPQITLQIIEENSKIIQQLLRDKVIDIGIYEKKSGFIDMEKHDYRADELVAVYSRAHFSFEDAPLEADPLLDSPLVSLGEGSAVLASLQRLHQSRGRALGRHFTVSGFDTMLALVRHGLGVGLMPPAVLDSLHPEPGIGRATLAGDWHQRSYVLSSVQGRAQEQTLRNVVAQLLES
ncbi:LysR family transcriptional regulator [Comamonas endophytica]|uniref:LysR family transcriptional regulator n=1 Tax=Comamonas endophytica TaxID=2949090 RepID=A0ABY6GA48_9BURK|nr:MULTISPECIES: LysR family transcriptional regulator [unclassified Acidovorax]MCD2511896.1 LysR family transcriptional regulator [Acidovorax sp. D4N7]UYG51615.1 LysR family transcriptional regulator [Acidovorax sp. 5MLIR]